MVSCNQKNDVSLGILKNNVLQREKALSFLKKVSKLQFHIDTNHKIVQDYKTITDTFLIRNVDLSYNKASNLIRKGLISEYSFANYILPYKLNSSTPNEWRNKSLSLYTISKEKLDHCLNSDSMINLCNDIDRYTKMLIKFKLDTLNENIENLDEILKRGAGSCLSFCNLNSYISRANGLPVTYDYVPAWGNLDGNHAWNVLVPNQKDSYPILSGESNSTRYNPLAFINSDKPGTYSYRVPPKVYRKGFIPDTSSVYLKHYNELNNIGITFTDIDVTDQYVKTIDFNTQHVFKTPARVLLLSVLNLGRWTPVAAISPEEKKYEFKNIGVENLYLISSLSDKKDKFVIYVDKTGNVHRFNSKNKNKIKIDRDRSIFQQQLDYTNKYGWNLPDSIKNLSVIETPCLSDDKEYQIFGMIKGDWKLLETKIPKHKEIISDRSYSDGLYVVIEKDLEITLKTRPFIFLNGKTIFI